MAITSRHNPIVARFRAVARGESSELVLLDGSHLVGDALAAGIRIREASLAVDGSDVAALERRLRASGVRVTRVSASVMQALSPVRSASPVVALAERPPAAHARVFRGTPLVVIAVDVQDPGNLGAIARVAEAAGADGLVCAGVCADPFGWKALRGSMGSALRLPILLGRQAGEAVSEARRHGCRIVAAVPREGTSLYEADLRGAVAIAVGGEGGGLPSSEIAAADARIMVPMRPPVESLNVAVSAALIVYEAARQRSSTPDLGSAIPIGNLRLDGSLP